MPIRGWAARLLTRRRRGLFSTSSSATTAGSGRFWLRGALAAAGAGYLYYAIQTVREAREKSAFYNIPPYKLALFRTVPLSCMTNAAGRLASLRVPPWLRGPLYGSYAWLYGCDLNECEPLASYETFNHFFARALKPQSRPLAATAMVSPADGKVLAFGRLSRDGQELYPEQIKGVRYPLRLLLRSSFAEFEGEERGERKAAAATSDLYYCSVYLAPGSYHRFHSPVEGFRVGRVERVAGEALPVAPWLMKLVPGLVSLNERAIISGSWRHGRLCMVPVGATNVRSISLRWPEPDPDAHQELNHRLGKGDEVGQFNMGSLVVLIFEAPKAWTWRIANGDWIKMGEALGDVASRGGSWWRWW